MNEMKHFSLRLQWLFNSGCCQIVIAAFFRMVHTTKHKVLFYEMNHKIKMQIGVVEKRTRAIENNDLHASDGRDTEALNCKPITNL
jgi:hypothetical protein